MIGSDAAEIMQGIAIALECGATKQQFDHAVGIHPSSAEEFVTMRTKSVPEVPALDMAADHQRPSPHLAAAR